MNLLLASWSVPPMPEMVCGVLVKQSQCKQSWLQNHGDSGTQWQTRHVEIGAGGQTHHMADVVEDVMLTHAIQTDRQTEIQTEFGANY